MSFKVLSVIIVSVQSSITVRVKLKLIVQFALVAALTCGIVAVVVIV